MSVSMSVIDLPTTHRVAKENELTEPEVKADSESEASESPFIRKIGALVSLTGPLERGV